MLYIFFDLMSLVFVSCCRNKKAKLGYWFEISKDPQETSGSQSYSCAFVYELVPLPLTF